VALCSDMCLQTAEQHRFTMWQTTGRNDVGVRCQAVISSELPHETHLQAARLADRRHCSCTKDVNVQLKPVLIYRPPRGRLG
jgi:hypothetical protein